MLGSETEPVGHLFWIAPGQLPKSRAPGMVGRRLLDLIAVAGQHSRAMSACASSDVFDKPGLPDTRLALQEDESA